MGEKDGLHKFWFVVVPVVVRILIVVGCDLMRADEEQRLYDHIARYKPKVLVMAPQCTGMAGWGRFNAVMNPEAHRRSERISHHLGTICANCAI